MKFALLTFLFFQLTFSLKSQEIENVKLLDDKGKIVKEFSFIVCNSDTLYHGTYKEYSPNGKIYVSCEYEKGIRIGKEYIYDRKGRINFINEYIGTTFPRKILTKAFYYSGACRYVEGEMIEKMPGFAVTEGIIKYYRKNMEVMDSVIFVNDRKTYRARFNRKGEFQFENRY